MNSPAIVVRLNRKALTLIAALLLVASLGPLLCSEVLSLTVTLPAPSAIYNALVTTGNSGASSSDTILNRNAGNTLLVPATNVGGKVGIGMVPVNKLDVAGGIGVTGSLTAASVVSLGGVKLGDDAAPCTAAKEGTLRWHSGALETCVGLLWAAQP